MLKHFNVFRWFFLFDADDKGGGGDSESSDDKAKGTDAEEEKDDKSKQKDLDKQFKERAERAAESARKKLLEDLGITDPDEAKKLLQSAREAEEKSKSETEKLQSLVAKEKAAREKAEADAKAKEEAANKRLLDSEIKIAASTAILDKEKKSVIRGAFLKEALDDVLLLINRELITLEEDGTYKGVEKALSDLAKAKPYLLEEKQQESRGTPRDSKRPLRQPGDGEGRTPIISSL